MTEEERKAKAQMYTSLMLTDGWRDLMKFAEFERELSTKRIDNLSSSDITLGVVFEERGIRKGLALLIRHAEYCREGK